MKQNAIRTIFLLVCCLLVALSPSLAATVKRANGDVGYALFQKSATHTVSGAVTFYQLNADTIIYGQFNTGLVNVSGCRLLIITSSTTSVDLTPFVAQFPVLNGGTGAFQFTLPGTTLRDFKNKHLVIKCTTPAATIGDAKIKVIP
ncbi:2922_t:CDS:1 [Paraglomus occultum]|uniref:2922_t:CDS:1 n=1 Tax=Paraglomus occultum TaxID=144539 RepID=A0A9N9CWY3_9GLOM|nr:2922_t:CDS:1 [Paraglomus occultum]